MAPKKRSRGDDHPKKIGQAKRAKLIAEQAVRIAEWAAQALVAAEQLGIKHDTVKQVLPQEAERTVVSVPAVPPTFRNA